MIDVHSLVPLFPVATAEIFLWLKPRDETHSQISNWINAQTKIIEKFIPFLPLELTSIWKGDRFQKSIGSNLWLTK